MPRQKRSSLVSKQKANKRWCNEHSSHETDVFRKDETSISSALKYEMPNFRRQSTVKSLNDVRSQVKSPYQSNSAITDIDVTFDGTWLTRGHSSQIGVGCMIDLLTGFVMDFEIMSKRCIECEPPNLVWEKIQQNSMCEAALKLWQRSEDSGFRYTTLLSNGDAKTYQYLNTKEVYGPEIKIKIEDCINHVSKRLGTSLRNAVKEWRARGVSLGGKSRGSLKEETIKKLSQYYQNAIHWNKGDVEAMKTAIYATLFHSISTDQKPQHFKCPTGKDSWCFFQAALARGEVPGPHVKHMKTPLKETHLAKIMPIYQRLASNELLHRCIRCVTQNANESLHSIIWARATIDLLKDTFGDRLISRFGPVSWWTVWPPRSCDLTPLDYFLWGYVKSLVYADKPQTLDHLEDNIRRVIADIRPQMLEKVFENWTSRLDYIRASRGSPIPEIIFRM
ncbi:uncharacterized protein TNCV_4910431 [Trichonephila clavipes]|nr:uncharacterized protein TNCV_4910431 [Trichonephila clavipes]